MLTLTCQKIDPLPNIIIVFTDDQGYADLGCYGAKGFGTPNIDRLANDGIRFTNFYVPATVCTPSRAGLMTGRYPKRADLHEAVIFPFSENGLASEELTMPEMLKTKGYETNIIGKWHLGHFSDSLMPWSHGFDYYFGVPYSNDMDSHYYGRQDFQAPPLPLYENQTIVEEGPNQKYLTKIFTEAAVDRIQTSKNPLFIYLAHSMPHLPLHVSESFEGISDLGLYGDVITEIDWSVGEIMKALKAKSIYENTILIFTSDNGPRVGSALPLRGARVQLGRVDKGFPG
jgi:arylsulfatase A-like enzyme